MDNTAEQPTTNKRANIALATIVLVVFAMLAGLSMARYLGFNAKYFDLGAMSQAVWSVTQGEPLVFTGHGFPLSRLARHVELIYFLFVPFYALVPSPLTLIVIQALFFAAGAVPLYRLANRHLKQPSMAVLIAVIYLLYPTAQEAVLFDIHGDTFAMPLLLFVIEAADRNAVRACLIWTTLALSAKFYVAIPIMFLGGILWIRNQRRLAMAMVVLAVIWGLMAFFVVLPGFAPSGDEALIGRATIETYLGSRFQELDLAVTGLLRLVHLLVVMAPAIIVLGWRAPLYLVPALAIALPAVLSTGFGPAFSYRTHHYAIAVPFLVVAVVYGASGLRVRRQGAANEAEVRAYAWRGRIILTLVVTLIFNVAFVDTPISPFFYDTNRSDGRGLDSNRFGIRPRDRFKDQWLAENPIVGPVAADEISASRLVNRPVLFITERPITLPLPEVLPDVDYVLTDAFYDDAIADPANPDAVLGPGIRQELGVIARLLEEPGFRLTKSRDGILLFARASVGLNQEAVLVSRGSGIDNNESLLATFGDVIGLQSVAIEQDGDRRYRATYEWIALRDLTEETPLIAVTEPHGMPFSRIVHLPSAAILPTTEWTTGDVVREVFEFELTADREPGSYPLLVGWYDTTSVYALETDGRSRVGKQYQTAVLDVR